ncbi:MAG TPA: HD domain-containing phosphohydrolase, partial [Capillimicrobium sp.]|nr:HD domain-containing phosphohydrolase [Capillimicrobium sp.]
AGAAGVALAAGWTAAAQWAFARGVVLPVAAPLVAAAGGLLAAVLGRYAVALRAGRWFERRSAALDAAVRRRTRELRDTQLEILQRLGRAAELRDDETGAHVERIGTLVRAVATAMGMARDDVELLEHASALHDLGKVGIPDRVLLKDGPLDAEERALMERHAAIGADILSGSSSPLVQLAETIARTHHERWDGTGYPAGLRGEEIPLAGRICAICDVFDALVSERRYKPAWTVEDALATIEAERGRHFDPAVVDAFVPVVRGMLGVGPAAGAASPEREAVAAPAPVLRSA